jgi:hypothetical protein
MTVGSRFTTSVKLNVLSPAVIGWQFLNAGETSGKADAVAYLIRSQCFNI